MMALGGDESQLKNMVSLCRPLDDISHHPAIMLANLLDAKSLARTYFRTLRSILNSQRTAWSSLRIGSKVPTWKHGFESSELEERMGKEQSDSSSQSR